MKKLQLKTQKEVQGLLTETGHVLTLDDIPDILELDEYARRVTSKGGDYSDVYSWPILCGSLILRPLTLGKMAWFNQCAMKWFEDEQSTITAVLAFLLSVENSEQFIWTLGDRNQAKAAIEEWQKMVDATESEMASAIEKLVSFNDQDGSAQGDGVDSDDGPLIGLLCREYGQSPKYWLYEESVNVIRALIDDHVAQINREIHASNRMSKGRGVAPIKTPSMDATLKFRKKIVEIRERWESDQ